jgi:hypothetical protein
VRPFTKQEIQLVTTFADQAVIAIENLRLFTELQASNRDLSEALQQQTATADVLKVISRSSFDLQAVLEIVVQNAVRLCDANKGFIYRQEGVSYRAAASYGHSPEFLEIVQRLPTTETEARPQGGPRWSVVSYTFMTSSRTLTTDGQSTTADRRKCIGPLSQCQCSDRKTSSASL